MSSKKKVAVDKDIDLGDEVKDQVTGFKGVVVAITRWITGCRRVTVQPQTLKDDGSVPETHTFDETHLTVTAAAKVPSPNAGPMQPVSQPGGPRPSPARRKDPT